MSKKLDMQFTFESLRYGHTYHKCPNCGYSFGCDRGYMLYSEVNKEITEHEICDECEYEYDITYKITVELKAEYSEPELCKRCDSKEEHEHVS